MEQIVERFVEKSGSGMAPRGFWPGTEYKTGTKNRREPSREGEALQRLARVFADESYVILQELADVVVEVCGAAGAGISIEDESETGEAGLRWVAAAGTFAPFLSLTTVNGMSARVNIGAGLFHTKAYSAQLGIMAEPITDRMVIPLGNGQRRATLWAVSPNSDETFSYADYKLLSSLAEFASLAMKHQGQEKMLRRQASEAGSAAKANEMAHYINNPLQSLTNTIYLAQQGGVETQAYLRKAREELAALSELVGKLLA